MSRPRQQRAARARSESKRSQGLWRWLARVALPFAIGVLAGCLGPWIIYLDHHAAERFVERQWKQAGRVYARPYEMYPGRAARVADVETELEAAGIRQTQPLLPGRYVRSGERFTIALPALRFADGPQSARTVTVTLSDDRIESVTDR